MPRCALIRSRLRKARSTSSGRACRSTPVGHQRPLQGATGDGLEAALAGVVGDVPHVCPAVERRGDHFRVPESRGRRLDSDPVRADILGTRQIRRSTTRGRGAGAGSRSGAAQGRSGRVDQVPLGALAATMARILVMVEEPVVTSTWIPRLLLDRREDRLSDALLETPPKPEYTMFPRPPHGSRQPAGVAPAPRPPGRSAWRNARRGQAACGRVWSWVMVFPFCRPGGGDALGLRPADRPGRRSGRATPWRSEAATSPARRSVTCSSLDCSGATRAGCRRRGLPAPASNSSPSCPAHCSGEPQTIESWLLPAERARRVGISSSGKRVRLVGRLDDHAVVEDSQRRPRPPVAAAARSSPGLSTVRI